MSFVGPKKSSPNRKGGLGGLLPVSGRERLNDFVKHFTLKIAVLDSFDIRCILMLI